MTPIRRSFLCGIAAALTAVLGFAPASAGPSILFDAQNGHVIESSDPFRRWYPASLTKLMTTYVAFRMVQAGEVTMASPIRMTKRAAKEPPSKMGYKPGAVLTLDNALKILMVKSANDVAMAVGESLAGSKEAFARRMNAEAARLGMTGTHWTNPHGLHDDNQYTTARDLALLSIALRREFPQHAGYFAIEGLAVGKKAIANHNTLIGRFDGADGMKTGYTCPSGYNLVASATRNGRTLMAVVVGSTSVASRAEQAAAMLVRGFASQTIGTPTLAEMKPVGTGVDQATNMFDQLCSKEARAKAARERKEKQAAAKAKKEDLAKTGKPDAGEEEDAAEVSPYLKEFAGPRHLVAVELGGATGPAPIGVRIAEAEEADPVPLPQWRPDRPPPPGSEPVIVQGAAITAR